MSRYLKRLQELAWLDRCTKMSHVVLVEGLKGCGKTTLLRQWLQEKKSGSKWFTLSNFSSLSNSLGEADLSMEKALEKAATQWQDQRVIVWDDIHNLDNQAQSYLINFLQQSFAEQVHIILSDEHIEHPPEIPQLTLKGFTREQTLEYLQQIEVPMAADQTESFLSLTGGMPLMIQLWINDPESLKRQSFALDKMSPPAQELLKTLSFYPENFSLAELQAFKIDHPQETLSELQRKMLINSVGDQFEITPFVKDLLKARLLPTEIQTHCEKVLGFLVQAKSQAKLQILSLALQSQNVKILEELSADFKISLLEGISSGNLALLVQWISAITKTSLQDFLLRLKIHCLILQNHRSEALALAEEIIGKNENPDVATATYSLMYDCIYWLNRSGRFDVTEKKISYYINTSPLPLKFFFKVEQALPLLGKDPKAAEESLRRLLAEIEKYPTKNEEVQLAKAHTFYQLGVCTNHQRKFDDAALFFRNSHQLYLESGRIYFSLFSLFNLVWILYNQKNFRQIQEWLPKVVHPAQMHGYKYLQAGLLWLESQMAYWNLEGSKALEKIIESFAKLEKSTPLQARADILSTKARILRDLGFIQRAQDIINELKSFYDKQTPPRLLSLELELQLKSLPLEDFREQWIKWGRSEDEDVFRVYLLERGFAPEHIDSSFERTLRGQLALKQYTVLKAIKEKDQTQLWTALSELESLLNKITEPRLERVAAFCFQAQAQQKENAAWQEKAELELARWGGDAESKRPLELWLKALKEKGSPLSGSEWKKISPTDKERWEPWIRHFETKKGRYLLKTPQGSSHVEEAPAQGHDNSVTVVEDLGKVFFNGEAVEDFNRKSILRQMLTLFLEVYPDKINKASLASALWGENYSPQIHDARIYTSIQRLRSLIADNVIENWDGGYRWNPSMAFYFYRSQVAEKLGSHRVKTLILESLRKKQESENPWMSRADLVELSDSSDATVKRILSELLTEGYLIRKGRGPSVVYAIDPNRT